MPTPARVRGFSLVECVVAMAIVGVVLVGSVELVGKSSRIRLERVQRDIAATVANDLIAEIRVRGFGATSGPFLQVRTEATRGQGAGVNAITNGPASGAAPSESTGARDAFDEIDDYHGYRASPPVERDGSTIDGADGLTALVAVAWYDPTANTVSTIATTTKLVVVQVYRGTKMIAERRIVRSKAAADLFAEAMGRVSEPATTPSDVSGSANSSKLPGGK